MQDDVPRADATRAAPSAADEAQARVVAEAAAAEWRRLDGVLSSVIGHGGVAALFRRSLFLVRAQCPWLPGEHAGALDPVEFSELQAALAQQTAADAAVADQDLKRTFHDLLASLIGSPLTERLLSAPSGSSSNGDAAQDTSS